MEKLQQIELYNYRALYGKHKINLTRSCKNLMIYGENGSGKSSICLALHDFIEATKTPFVLAKYENKFVTPAKRNSGYMKLSFKDTSTLIWIDSKSVCISPISLISVLFLFFVQSLKFQTQTFYTKNKNSPPNVNNKNLVADNEHVNDINLQVGLTTICNKEMDEQKAMLENEFNAWKGDNEQTDDVLVMGVRI